MTRQQVDDTLAVQRAVEVVMEHGEPSLQHSRLPRVLHETPAAVLLLDATTRCVVQALASAPQEDAEAICEHLLDSLADDDLEDDVALLVVRVVA